MTSTAMCMRCALLHQGERLTGERNQKTANPSSREFGGLAKTNMRMLVFTVCKQMCAGLVETQCFLSPYSCGLNA